MSNSPVTLSRVTKRYGAQRGVEAVDLELRPGERIALVGHNGAGKSTLIKLMLGLIRPTEGQVRVLGEDPAHGAAIHAKMQIGYLPENLVLHPAMTGFELMDFYARLKRRPIAANRSILERVGIAEAAGRRIQTYSKGMRQRIGLAQALIGQPQLLLLDEPTSGLDPALRQSFYEIVGELARDGATVLISSHALAELEGQSDRVVVMNLGQKVADGTISELRHLAERPVRIRLSFDSEPVALAPEIFGNTAQWEWIGKGILDIQCPAAEKASLIRKLGQSRLPFRDIEISAPSLDEIYAHFLRREVRQEAAQ